MIVNKKNLGYITYYRHKNLSINDVLWAQRNNIMYAITKKNKGWRTVIRNPVPKEQYDYLQEISPKDVISKGFKLLNDHQNLTGD